ncbi:MAG: hypothetical protein KF799_10290 [Bdellovibrionales bacterium]|nr:hypothetical protein [Bdellovibrionales bacterium]
MILRLSSVVLAFTFSVAALADNYCLAIRGNGELAPAHWGAVSNVVERLGLPQVQAGGSSASITMFLLDAIASNRYVRAAGEEQRKERASLLIKSLEGFSNFLMQTKEFKEFKILYAQMMAVQEAQSLEQVQKLLQSAASIRENEAIIRSSLQTALEIGLLNKNTLGAIQRSLQLVLTAPDVQTAQLETERLRFYVSELVQSISVVGEFDAATDANLFFRPGFVDFDALAQQLGQIGEFYSARESSAQDETAWQKFLNKCAPISKGKQWPELAARGCDDLLNQLIALHFSRPHKNFAAELVGQSISSFPTTAVLTGNAVIETAAAFERYQEELNPKFGLSFKVSTPQELRFGYWGDEGDLRRVENSLVRDDEKSRRFLALGRAPWAEILGLSPAEPGLSPLRAFSHGKQNFVSAGGWSDLHPVKVLKAAGCESVVYITRRGGESLFAQGVAKRLLSIDPQDVTGTDTSFGRKWDMLRTKPKADADRNWILNNQGDTSDMTSLWSRLYNVANPQSSLRQSLAAADAILCTDWNSFALVQGPREMISDAYTSPYFVPAGSRLASRSALTPRLDSSQQHADGYYKYVGCF